MSQSGRSPGAAGRMNCRSVAPGGTACPLRHRPWGGAGSDVDRSNAARFSLYLCLPALRILISTCPRQRPLPARPSCSSWCGARRESGTSRRGPRRRTSPGCAGSAGVSGCAGGAAAAEREQPDPGALRALVPVSRGAGPRPERRRRHRPGEAAEPAPVVLSREEVRVLLGRLEGSPGLA